MSYFTRTTRTSLRWLVVLAIAATSLVESALARAQSRPGFAAGRFEPAERGSRWFVVDSLDFRDRLHPAIGVTLDHAYRPLVVEDSAGVERFALVRHQLMVHASASLALNSRVRFGLDVPIAAWQDGEGGRVAGATYAGANAPAFGDLRLAADVRLLGRSGEPIVLAAGARAWLPTGLRSQFTSDGALRVAPQVLASGDIGAFSWAARLAVVYRARDDAYAGSELGSELAGGIGAGLRLGSRLNIGPELWASSVFTGGHFLGARETPVDGVFGAHYDLAALRFGAAIGTGLSPGQGAPSLRMLLSVEWAPPAPEVPSDHDRDGIPDREDACPDEPGVHDSDPTANGCPPPPPIPSEDSDGDGVSDTDDACPAIAGVRTTDPMTNGCPPSSAPRPLAVVTKTEIRIGEQIRFATNSADVLTDSDAVLGAVERILSERPEIRKVRIEGHTDAVGDPTYNHELSERRAAAVKDWLVRHGIDASRLESKGFGRQRPIDTNDTEAGRANNRRVVFTIVEQDPPR
ncbi:MAG: outer membrane protein [Labilithrix sp.]|nr:outer membrane protein [Labilithrix sp.]